jgi:hypothetical protein
MNLLETLGDSADGALLGLPLLQRKPRIHCRCNCILPELLILPCIIADKSSDITLFISPFQTHKILWIRRIAEKVKSYILCAEVQPKRRRRRRI